MNCVTTFCFKAVFLQQRNLVETPFGAQCKLQLVKLAPVDPLMCVTFYYDYYRPGKTPIYICCLPVIRSILAL